MIKMGSVVGSRLQVEFVAGQVGITAFPQQSTGARVEVRTAQDIEAIRLRVGHAGKPGQIEGAVGAELTCQGDFSPGQRAFLH